MKIFYVLHGKAMLQNYLEFLGLHKVFTATAATAYYSPGIGSLAFWCPDLTLTPIYRTSKRSPDMQKLSITPVNKHVTLC